MKEGLLACKGTRMEGLDMLWTRFRLPVMRIRVSGGEGKVRRWRAVA